MISWQIMRIFVWLVLICLVSCAPATWEEFRLEGEAETRKFAAELRKIETQEELVKALPKIKKRFNMIADLLVKISGKTPVRETEPSLASDALFMEMARIYEMPGGRELIESCQSEAVRKLDKSTKR